MGQALGCGGGEGGDGRGAPGVTEADRALLDVKAQRDQLGGHLRRLRAELARDEDAARSLVRGGQRERALLALRQRKHHQQLLDECAQHLCRLDEVIGNIELACMQRDTVEALAAGVKTLRKVQAEIGGPDRIRQVLEERSGAIAAQQELSMALGGAGVSADDAEALAELSRLEATLAGDASSVPSTPADTGHKGEMRSGPISPAASSPPLPA